MPYLICEKCGGYYELQKGECLSDFDCCQCGGKLKYYKDIVQEKNIISSNPTRSNHKLNADDEIKKIIDYNIDFQDNARLKRCMSCGTLNHNKSEICSKCDKSLLSLKEKEDLNDEYLQENEYLKEYNKSQDSEKDDEKDDDYLAVEMGMPKERLKTYTSKLGANRFLWTANNYVGGILCLVGIPLISYALGTNILILTPLFVFLLILFISLAFIESNEFDDVVVETVFFTFVFLIPGIIFILIPLNNIFGYIIAFTLFMGDILSILVAQLAGIYIRTRNQISNKYENVE